MTKYNKKHKGFTMSEMMIVITIIAIITIISVRISKSKSNYESSFMTYAAFTNLKSAIGGLIADGYLDAGSNRQTGLPPSWNSAALPYGLCQRLADATITGSGIFNVTGTPNCGASTTTTIFTNTYLLFTTTNGQRFFYSGGAYPYTIYVDINGLKGTGTINQDVLAFTVAQDGTVLPASNSIAYTNTNYLSASVKYVNAGLNTTLYNGVTFQDAACFSRLLSGATYCTGHSADANCPNTAANTCEVVVNKPGF